MKKVYVQEKMPSKACKDAQGALDHIICRGIEKRRTEETVIPKLLQTSIMSLRYLSEAAGWLHSPQPCEIRESQRY